MKLISLFSGIGGFELAAEWMGWTPVVSCEINPFGRKVLEHYWPQAYHHTDIKTLTYEKINEELTQRFGPCWRSDDIILTGGFPCQPYSMAGKRLGKEDDRHLWPEMLRVIREVQPTWIVGENVFGLVNWNGGLVFHEVQTDLEAQGYEVQPYVLPACAVNAPHRRDRVWFVAYRDRKWSRQKHEFCTRRDLPEEWVDKCRIATNTNSCRYRGLAETPGNHNAESIRWMDKNCGQNRNEIRCEIDGCGWSSPHPNGNGLNWSDCEHEVNPSQGGEYAQRNFEQMGRDAAYPNGNPTRTPGESRSIEGIGSNINVQQSERGSKTELNNRSSSVSQPAAHTENVRSGKLPNTTETPGTSKSNDIPGSSSRIPMPTTTNQPPQPTSGHPTNKNHHSAPDEITPNTSSSRRKNRLYGTSTNEQQKANQLGNTNTKQPPNWSNFPTVSPLRSRNDGLSNYTHRETISEGHTMDRTELILQCLSEGRIETNPETGKIFSKMIRGSEGELIELKGSDCNGYLVHSLKYNGIKKQVKAHQIIWMSVYGFYNKKEYQIDHINRNKKDNRIQNLRLVTAKENNANQNRWEGNFTEEQKDAMFLMHYEGHMSFRELAEDFGCSKSRVHQIVTEHKFNQLDGITFSKWRNESIKAAGNAIVPQVALQIFKAIEKYNQLV